MPQVSAHQFGFLEAPIAALSIGTNYVTRTLPVCRNALLEMLDTEPVPRDTIRNIRSPSITLRVTLVGQKMGREISAHTLLDSGAEGIIFDSLFAKCNELTLCTLAKPILVKNVDGTLNQQGAVRYTMIQTIRIKSPDNEYHEERSELYVTALGNYDVIFGTDWLQAHNPEVDWAKLQLAFTCCPKSCKLLQKPLVLEPKSKESHTTVISRIEPLEEYHAVEVESTNPELFARIHQWDKENYVHVRSKLTTSTELAAQTAPRPSMSVIPERYRSFTKVFSEEASHRLPAHRPWDHAIDLIPGKTMKNSGIYCLTPGESTALKEYITEHLRKGYICPSTSSMASPFFFVDKKDGKLRPVQDYRKLNDITVKNAAPLPLIPDLIDKLQGARYFTKLDVRWGYNNIRIKEGDEHKAAFKTALGLYEPLVMTFGLCNVPATFQTFMNNIFEDLLDTGQVVIYLDDILIFTHTIDQLDRLMRKVLERLEHHDLFLKPEKCFFNQKSIEYLGVIISEGQVKMDQAKVHGILNWPTPKTLKNVQAFLGFCNFYRRFIQDFSAIMCPLLELTKKDTPFSWGDAQEHAFRALITAFTTAPVLALPDHAKPFQLITDASAFATGTILEQPDAFNRWQPHRILFKVATTCRAKLQNSQPRITSYHSSPTNFPTLP